MVDPAASVLPVAAGARAGRPEAEGQGDEPEPVGKYLGGVALPVSSIYHSGVLEGTVVLDVPAILLGYAQTDKESTLSARPSEMLARIAVE